MNKIKLTKMVKKIGSIPIYSLLIAFCFSLSVFASEEVPGIEPTKKLLAAGAAGVTALIAGATTFKAIVNALAWQAATEEEKPAKVKALKNVLLIGIIGFLSGGIVTYVLGFYGG